MSNRGRTTAAEPTTMRESLVVQDKHDLLDEVSELLSPISSSAPVQVLKTGLECFAIAARQSCVQAIKAAFRTPTVESGNAEALEKQVLRCVGTK